VTARTRRRGALARLLAAVLVLAAAAGCGGAPDLRPRSDPAAFPLVVPAPDYDRRFSGEGPGWTGGDGTLSVLLPDGRTAWLFGDTFLGRVASDGSRSPDTPFLRNSIVLDRDGRLGPVLGATASAPQATFPSPERGSWYWPGDGTVEGGSLRVFLHRYRQTAPGIWNWRWEGTALATLALPGLSLEGIRPAGPANGVRYGVCLLETDAWTYVFGVEERGGRKYAHAARAHRGRIGGAWFYFDGEGWSEDPGATAPFLADVSDQFAVVPCPDGLALFTMDLRSPFSGDLAAYLAPGPEGPWTGPVLLFRAPEGGPDTAAYNPFAHPQFGEGPRLLVSYNVNHVSDPDALFRDASIYRPRFLWVDRDGLCAAGREEGHGAPASASRGERPVGGSAPRPPP
jgi:hypothetical protein